MRPTAQRPSALSTADRPASSEWAHACLITHAPHNLFLQARDAYHAEDAREQGLARPMLLALIRSCKANEELDQLFRNLLPKQLLSALPINRLYLDGKPSQGSEMFSEHHTALKTLAQRMMTTQNTAKDAFVKQVAEGFYKQHLHQYLMSAEQGAKQARLRNRSLEQPQSLEQAKIGLVQLLKRAFLLFQEDDPQAFGTSCENLYNRYQKLYPSMPSIKQGRLIAAIRHWFTAVLLNPEVLLKYLDEATFNASEPSTASNTEAHPLQGAKKAEVTAWLKTNPAAMTLLTLLLRLKRREYASEHHQMAREERDYSGDGNPDAALMEKIIHSKRDEGQDVSERQHILLEKLDTAADKKDAAAYFTCLYEILEEYEIRFEKNNFLLLVKLLPDARAADFALSHVRLLRATYAAQLEHLFFDDLSGALFIPNCRDFITRSKIILPAASDQDHDAFEQLIADCEDALESLHGSLYNGQQAFDQAVKHFTTLVRDLPKLDQFIRAAHDRLEAFMGQDEQLSPQASWIFADSLSRTPKPKSPAVSQPATDEHLAFAGRLYRAANRLEQALTLSQTTATQQTGANCLDPIATWDKIDTLYRRAQALGFTEPASDKPAMAYLQSNYQPDFKTHIWLYLARGLLGVLQQYVARRPGYRQGTVGGLNYELKQLDRANLTALDKSVTLSALILRVCCAIRRQRFGRGSTLANALQTLLERALNLSGPADWSRLSTLDEKAQLDFIKSRLKPTRDMCLLKAPIQPPLWLQSTTAKPSPAPQQPARRPSLDDDTQPTQKNATVEKSAAVVQPRRIKHYFEPLLAHAECLESKGVTARQKRRARSKASTIRRHVNQWLKTAEAKQGDRLALAKTIERQVQTLLSGPRKGTKYNAGLLERRGMGKHTTTEKRIGDILAELRRAALAKEPLVAEPAQPSATTPRLVQ